MAQFHFPELNINQILTGLSELCSLQLDESFFKKPDSVQWQEVFRRMLCEVKGIPEDTLMQPLVLLGAEYPDAHLISVPVMNIVVMMQRIMPILGVHDFNGGDLISPNGGRLRKICSAIINFLRFKHSRVDVYENIRAEMEQEKEHLDTLLKRKTELRQKIDQTRSERAQQEPEIATVQEEIEQVSMKMLENQRRKQNLQKTISDLKTKIADRKTAADQLKCSILKTKDDGEKLSSKIVHSPEKVRAEQENLNHQLIALKDCLEQKRSRLGQLQKLRESFKQYTLDADRALKLFESIKADIDRETASAEAMILIHDKIQETYQQSQELCNKKIHLQSRLSLRQEKLAKLSLQHQSRMKVLQEQYSCLKEEKDSYVAKQSSDSERRLELTELKRKLQEEARQEQALAEERIDTLRQMYATLIEKTDSSHSDFQQNWEEIKALLKE